MKRSIRILALVLVFVMALSILPAVAVQAAEAMEKLPQKAFTCTASQDRGGNEVAKANDGKLDTFWHTTTGNNPPYDFYVELNEKQPVLALEISGRPDGSTNGFLKKFEVYAGDTTAACDTLVQSVDWSAKKIGFNQVEQVVFETPVEAKCFRLHITDTHTAKSSPYIPAHIAEFNVLVPKQESVVDGEIYKLQSPDGQTEVSFWMDTLGTPWYSVTRAGQVYVQPSSLGVTMDAASGGPMTRDLKLVSQSQRTVDTTWIPGTAYTRSEIPDRYQEKTFCLEDDQGRKMNLVFRAYDEGMGFRYEFPEGGTLTDFNITAENSQFAIPAGTDAFFYGEHAQSVPGSGKVEKLGGNYLSPLVLTYAGGKSAAIFESNNYNAARLTLHGEQNGTFTSRLWKGGNTKGTAPFHMPWRGMMFADSIGQLHEVNYMVMNLADEQYQSDVSWITTGQMIREAKLTEENTKECIAFAKKNNIEYILYDSGWYGTENDPNMSPMKPVIGEFPYMLGRPDKRSCHVDVRDAAKWAAEEGIGLVLYINHLHMEKYDLDEVFSEYEKWGIKAVKFGFVNVGTQYWTQWLANAIQTAADHHLGVVIHDEYIPSGLERIYPNILNIEGVAGDETKVDYNGDLKMCFVRTLLGPTDHTFCYPAGYRGAKRTDAFSLANPILYTGALSSPYWYGSPKEYSSGNYPELKFWNDLPGEWDETLCLGGEFGKSLTLARRSGREWFLGSNSALNYTLELVPDFLEPGVDYYAEVYTNSPGDTIQKNKVALSQWIVTADTRLQFPMIPGGGLCIRLAPATAEQIANTPVFSAYRQTLAYELGRAEYQDLSKFTTRSVEETDIEAVTQAARQALENNAPDAQLQAHLEALQAARAGLVERTQYLEKIPQSQFRVWASTDRPGKEAATHAVDGDLKTIWQSAAPLNPPHDFYIDLGEETAIDVLELVRRPGPSMNGSITEFEVYTGETEEQMDTLIGSYTWKDDIYKNAIRQFPLPAGTVTRYLRIHVTASYINSGNYRSATIAELNLFGNPIQALNQRIAQAEERKKNLTDETVVAHWDEVLGDARDYAETAEDSQDLQTWMDAVQALLDSYDAEILKQDIDALGEVTLADKEKVAALRERYEALSQEEQALVTNLDKLEAAEQRLVKLQEDVDKAKAVEDQIAALGDVTPQKAEDIAAARAAYEALTQDQQALVPNLETLEAAEALLAELMEVVTPMEELEVRAADKETYEEIQAIRAAYDAMTPENQARIAQDYAEFQKKTETYDALLEQAKEETRQELAAQYDDLKDEHLNLDQWEAVDEVYEDALEAVEDARYEEELEALVLAFERDVDKITAPKPEIPGQPTEPHHPSFDPDDVEQKPADSQLDSFLDVQKTDWYYGDVAFAVSNGLFNGTSNSTFSPNAPMTRGMLVTVLYRLAGEPQVTGTADFADVPDNQWYSDAVKWAADNNIVNGVGNGCFAPDTNITREQMAAILYRYAGYRGADTTAREDLSGYADYAQISEFARTALEWAKAEGLVNGRTETTLAPAGTATRAEVAAILHRFVNSTEA